MGADAVILDLEDAVPLQAKERARELVREVLGAKDAWVRVNAPRTDLCERDLRLVGRHAVGIRVPKVESAQEAEWIAERVPGKRLICGIESARGLLNAHAIASVPGVCNLALGGVDLARDLGVGDGDTEILYARSHLVVVSRAAGIDPPIDRVYTKLRDDEGLRREAELACRLGFLGKSAIHPRQLPIVHAAFTPTAAELEWASHVVQAFQESGGSPTRLADGEFVDLPVQGRAQRLLSRRPPPGGGAG